MTRNRILVLLAIVLAIAVYAIGPRLLAPQSDTAANRCADSTSGDVSSIRWRLFPTAGWVCQDDQGHETYLAWWA